MKTAVLWALVALNGALLLSLLNQHNHGESTANAQVGGRRPGEYIMVDGTIPGSSSGLVYVIDTVNGQLGALTYNDSNPGNKIESMPPIDLASVFSPSSAPAAPARPKHAY
jgi:hypothetical protein